MKFNDGYDNGDMFTLRSKSGKETSYPHTHTHTYTHPSIFDLFSRHISERLWNDMIFVLCLVECLYWYDSRLSK